MRKTVFVRREREREREIERSRVNTDSEASFITRGCDNVVVVVVDASPILRACGVCYEREAWERPCCKYNAEGVGIVSSIIPRYGPRSTTYMRIFAHCCRAPTELMNMTLVLFQVARRRRRVSGINLIVVRSVICTNGLNC